MRPAAEEATIILVHYLRHAAEGHNLNSPDTFAEIQDVMQDLIDEAVNKAIATMRGTERQQLPPDWTYSPPVKQEPEPLGPMCVKSGEDLEQLPAERLSHVYNCDSCERAMEQGDADGASR
jgi:hypothetical protein